MNTSGSGYSGTPLIKKLGYKTDETVCVLNAPDTFTKYLSANNTKLVKQLPADWLQLFCKTQAEFNATWQNVDLKRIISGCWLCLPKRSSALQTDISERDFRGALLPLGWVDVKVCAIDDTWSALKFVRRKV